MTVLLKIKWFFATVAVVGGQGYVSVLQTLMPLEFWNNKPREGSVKIFSPQLAHKLQGAHNIRSRDLEVAIRASIAARIAINWICALKNQQTRILDTG